MSKIKMATAITRVVQITPGTKISTIDNLLANTEYTLPAFSGGDLVLDDGVDEEPVEYGDFLVRLADDVFVYGADEFARHFRTA